MKIYIKWSLKAWPVLIPLLILTIHLSLIFSPCIDNFTCVSNYIINKYLSFLLQVIGGYLILISINSNIQLFKNTNIKYLVICWFKSFPNKRGEPLAICPKDANSVSRALTPRLVIPPNPENSREVVDYFLREIEVLNNQVIESKQEIIKLETKLNSNTKVQTKVNSDVSGVIKEITIGGLKPQLFGLILVFYGAVINLFA